MITPTRKPGHRRATTLLAALVAVALAVTGAGRAVAAPATSATSRQVSFAGTTFASQSNESVDLVGTLHVVTALSGSEETGWSLDWQTNVNNTTATGQTSGDRYVGHGTDRGTVLMPPGPPTRPHFEPSFTLMPPGPPTHPPSPIRLNVHVHFDETGQVTDIEVRVVDGSFGTVD